MPYSTVAEIRAFDSAVTAEAYPEQQVSEALALASEYIDRATRQWFEPRQRTLAFAGNGFKDIVLEVPPISISSVKVSDQELHSDHYRVITENRMCPLLRHKSGVWPQETEIIVEGSFGYVEEDDSAPPLIKRLCRIVTVKILKEELESDSAELVSEQIGDYSYSKQKDATGSTWMASREAARILTYFRRPLIRTI